MVISVTHIFDLFHRSGWEPYGEAVTQTEHALQTAYLAREAGESSAMIGACLLHDIGQLLSEAGHAATCERRDARHEMIGATYLESRMPEAVTAPIRLHVAAKRFLCRRDPSYRASLSPASQLSLELQGGPFSEAAADAFEHLPFATEAVRLRRYDDSGKRVGLELPPLISYRSFISELMR